MRKFNIKEYNKKIPYYIKLEIKILSLYYKLINTLKSLA